jgi:hypothetical protein
MSKKTNTLFFILVATIFNIIVTVLSFLAILLIYSKFLYQLLPGSSTAWILPLGFVIAIVASFLVYRLAMKIFMKKVDLEKYFDPIFSRRRSRK